MKCNIGKTERAIRIIVGGAMIGGGLVYESWWGALGLMPLITGFAGTCPAYILTGKKSCDIN
ncbi:MAG: DUF2892 domain-containing protein [Gammaproteobacteria bacterium]|nr:DUF2892 domain-containing protein [Gammaproteobacteria bacterium]